MTSYQQFMPGKRANLRRILQNLSLLPAEEYGNSGCLCLPDKYDKTTIPASNSPSIRMPTSQRISYLARHRVGGRTQFGNFYLGEGIDLNYLGRREGMPGGGGMPPRNQFN